MEKEDKQMVKWRFVAVDVDGTLLDDHDHYNVERLNNDVQQLTARGVHFIIASGNSLDALKAIFASSPLVNTFVAENGGRIIADGYERFSQPHDRQTIKQLLDWERGLAPQPDLLSLSGGKQTFIAERFEGVPVPYYPHHAYFKSLADVDEPIFNLNLNWFKQRPALSWIMGLADQLNQRFPVVHATYSGAYGIDVLPTGVNKAIGLARLAKQLGSTLDELVAFGDTANDLEMIQAAGCGYAMKNATPDLLTVADRVTRRDNNHDGLLNEIERLFGLTP